MKGLLLNELASTSGRPTDDLVEDALAGYLSEEAEVRNMLDSRYEDIKSGRVKPIDGEAFFESLREREDELLKKRTPNQATRTFLDPASGFILISACIRNRCA